MKTPWNHHFPRVFRWFSYDFPMIYTMGDWPMDGFHRQAETGLRLELLEDLGPESIPHPQGRTGRTGSAMTNKADLMHRLIWVDIWRFTKCYTMLCIVIHCYTIWFTVFYYVILCSTVFYYVILCRTIVYSGITVSFLLDDEKPLYLNDSIY